MAGVGSTGARRGHGITGAAVDGPRGRRRGPSGRPGRSGLIRGGQAIVKQNDKQTAGRDDRVHHFGQPWQVVGCTSRPVRAPSVTLGTSVDEWLRTVEPQTGRGCWRQTRHRQRPRALRTATIAAVMILMSRSLWPLAGPAWRRCLISPQRSRLAESSTHMVLLCWRLWAALAGCLRETFRVDAGQSRQCLGVAFRS